MKGFLFITDTSFGIALLKRLYLDTGRMYAKHSGT